MRYRFQEITLFLCLANLYAREPELPLCPTNVQYFPQNLPMHCRMPATVRSGKIMDFLPLPAPGIPGPVPAPIPGMVPGPIPMPLAMPQPPSHKLPVVVMPFYSPDTKNSYDRESRHKKHRFGYKRRPKHFYRSDEDSADTDRSSDDSSDRSSEHGWWMKNRGGRRSNRQRSKRRRHHSKDLLTPVLQYVTKDGYVIFEKQISKGEAKNWLGNKKVEVNKKASQIKNEENVDSKEYRGDNPDTKVLVRDEENVEDKPEDSPRQIHHSRSIKRKLPKKHVTE